MIVEPKGYYNFLRAIQDPLPSLNKTKPEDILDRHLRALHNERLASGKLPVVCVVGKHDYDELMGTLMTLYGASLVTDKSIKGRLNEVMGIVTVKSHSFDHGFFFGSEDREREEPKKSEPTIAEKIAAELFTSGNGNHADTLEMKMKDGGYGGGWGQSNVAKRIQEILDESKP